MHNVLLLLFLFSFSVANSQSFETGSLVPNGSESNVIAGIVLDHENENNPLAFSTVSVMELGVSTLSDLDGSFKFHLKPGTYTLVYSFIGYQNSKRIIKVSRNGSLAIEPEILKATALKRNYLAMLSKE